jgi:hypothetical protein
MLMCVLDLYVDIIVTCVMIHRLVAAQSIMSCYLVHPHTQKKIKKIALVLKRFLVVTSRIVTPSSDTWRNCITHIEEYCVLFSDLYSLQVHSYDYFKSCETKVKFDENASLLLLKLRKVYRHVIIYTRSIIELKIIFG